MDFSTHHYNETNHTGDKTYRRNSDLNVCAFPSSYTRCLSLPFDATAPCISVTGEGLNCDTEGNKCLVAGTRVMLQVMTRPFKTCQYQGVTDLGNGRQTCQFMCETTGSDCEDVIVTFYNPSISICEISVTQC